MASIAIVGFYLGINALLFVFLSAKIASVRRNDKISIGDGDDKTFGHLIRAHGNAAEYMPIFFIMLLLAAHLATPPLALHVLGFLFTVGRFLHASWFLKPSLDLKWRVISMIMTFTAITLTAFGLLAHGVLIMAGGY